ncbi:MAG: hypothetical protein QOI08_3005, partial [Actinomycetota bacterium]|nr:hypothetical protein [Actinomycetota bacterium]
IPARTALARAARWFVENGSVKPARVERIRAAGRLEGESDLAGTNGGTRTSPPTRQGTQR